MPSPKRAFDPDKCVFINCSNGKHNGHHLFRFPHRADRQKIWIQRSGNTSIANLSVSRVRKAGLCRIHFTKDSFTNSESTKLYNEVNPVPWNVHLSFSVTQPNLLEKQPSSAEVKINKTNKIAYHNEEYSISQDVDEERNAVTLSSSKISLADNDNSLRESSLHNLQKRQTLKTYPSGKKLCLNFTEEDNSRMEYLNFESEIKNLQNDPILDTADKNVFSQIHKENLRLKKRNKKMITYASIGTSKFRVLRNEIANLKRSLRNEKAKNKRLIEKNNILKEELYLSNNYLDKNG